MGDKSGRDRLEQRSDAWVDRQAGNLADRPGRTIAGWGLKLGAAVIVLVVFFGVLGFVQGWFNAGKDVASPANVKAQYHAVIEDWQGMEAAAQNACQAKAAKHEQGDPALVESPSLAYDSKYRQIVVDYNERQNNLFEAKEVGPKGYPRYAPSLKKMQAKVC